MDPFTIAMLVSAASSAAGVGMGAMTMGFETLSRVDLAGFAKGDKVAFSVKQGRDGSFRVTVICNIEAHGKDCLPKLTPN